MKTLKKLFIIAAAAASLTLSNYALTITAPNPQNNLSTGTPVPVMAGNQNNTADILAFLSGTIGAELYKSDVSGTQGNGADGGTFSSSYNTKFSNTKTDPSDALITYVGAPAPAILGGSVYLLVKDGNQTPAWYLYLLNWNGTDEIKMTGFWPDQGAISHVSLYGAGNSVPDGGATAILLGLGVAGLAITRRVRKA